MTWETKDWVAAYAAVVSTFVFLWTMGKEIHDRFRVRKERSKLHLYMSLMSVKNQPDGRVFHILPLHVSNLGREPVIITAAVARGPGYQTHPGVFAEPGAAYGVQQRVLPKKLEAGQTVELPLFSIGVLASAVVEVVIIDADDREYKVSAENLNELREKCRLLLLPA